ncbi:unnamed protein product (macronuclear) [Paramecium tetraurelia]|uniref:P1/s1 nuclease n=1 Tax=Paramecium tetraurelia TaxID=5888 RepID=A0C205_PARTE|nr:uncharacterized protein GSPATT00034299001 [Paramecium tetraurelia]CAK64822.1 unnamed protein product [Paramecium tetraurelia]|eukprot:XP_001432219.1 hypothetical protein (macronuclear) [Paramecium tetraurelia strain d4-2]
MKALLLLAISYVVQCWWDVGHMMTAQIAKNYLKDNRPDTLAWADSLVQDLNSLTDGKSNTFAEAAVWMDDIKETGTSFMNDWHYTDRPINPDGLLIKIEDQNRNINSIYAINQAVSVLTNSKTARNRHTVFKAQMLRVLLHVIGDLHQPLHDTTFWNSSYPNGDQGGNFMKVQLENGTLVNLHSFWDAGAFAFSPNNSFLVRPLSQSDQEYLNKWSLDVIKKYQFTKYINLDMTNPSVWTYVGYRQAIQFVYPMIAGSNNYNKDYVKQAQEFCEENLAIGGYRLAQKLIDIYDQILSNEAKLSLVD